MAMALTCAQTDWTKAKSRGEFVGVMAFDLSAAFDTVSATTLLRKLQLAGLSGWPLKWIECLVDPSQLSGTILQVIFVPSPMEYLRDPYLDLCSS